MRLAGGLGVKGKEEDAVEMVRDERGVKTRGGSGWR